MTTAGNAESAPSLPPPLPPLPPSPTKQTGIHEVIQFVSLPLSLLVPSLGPLSLPLHDIASFPLLTRIRFPPSLPRIFLSLPCFLAPCCLSYSSPPIPPFLLYIVPYPFPAYCNLSFPSLCFLLYCSCFLLSFTRLPCPSFLPLPHSFLTHIHALRYPLRFYPSLSFPANFAVFSFSFPLSPSAPPPFLTHSSF